jgi:Tol biopolymer transport system component
MFLVIDDAGNRRLVTIAADGGKAPEPLANQEGTHYTTDAEWSPDGQQVVYSSDREPRRP